MSANDPNVGIAFALVIGAGAATGIGASVVFFPRLVRLASRRTLAGALGLSAGVMTYVSFVEIFQKAVGAFIDAGEDDDYASVLATVCFFGGVVFMMLLNSLVTLCLGGHHHHHHSTNVEKDTHPISETNQPDTSDHRTDKIMTVDDAAADAACPCHAEDPAGNLGKIQDMAESIVRRQKDCSNPNCKDDAVCLVCSESQRGEQGNEDVAAAAAAAEDGQVEEDDDDSDDGEGEGGDEEEDKDKLLNMSIKTALAIALHNFPEGLATFVAALGDPKVGVVLAIAIAIHNIPEGLCVAMPIYYATGNRWKAFGWALFSGVSEPIAALLGWAVLANNFSNTLYGVLFGMVAGMMVIISIRELLPTAHRYDTEDSVVTYSFMAGMAIMAISLILFLL